jgi:hypothetical protein
MFTYLGQYEYDDVSDISDFNKTTNHLMLNSSTSSSRHLCIILNNVRSSLI